MGKTVGFLDNEICNVIMCLEVGLHGFLDNEIWEKYILAP
jgi:hypothetical protein